MKDHMGNGKLHEEYIITFLATKYLQIKYGESSTKHGSVQFLLFKFIVCMVRTLQIQSMRVLLGREVAGFMQKS